MPVSVHFFSRSVRCICMRLHIALTFAAQLILLMSANNHFPFAGFLVAILLASAAGGLQSCKHDPFSPDITDPGDTTVVTPGNPCSADSVYFELQILPILRSNCALSGCHDEASRQEGVILTSYQRVMQTANVRPGNLSGSDLYEVITETRPDKIMPPPPRQGLSTEQIALIAKWINQGARNLTCDANAGACQTTNMSWSQHIRPVIQTYCLGCHSGAAPGAGLNFSTHAGVAATVSGGRLYGAINHQSGFVAMPLGGAKMPECNILQIESWIDAGAPNN